MTFKGLVGDFLLAKHHAAFLIHLSSDGAVASQLQLELKKKTKTD